MLLCAAFAASVACWAVPAKRGYRAVTQPDGSTIMIEKRGDEHLHITVDEAGYLRRCNEAGYYEYATVDTEGNIVKSASPVRYDASEVASRIAARSQSQSASARRKVPGVIGTFPGSTFPTLGDQRAIVVLVEYTDQKFMMGDDDTVKEYFTNMLNQEGFSAYSGTGSARDYFIEMSGGKFVPEFDVYGPITLSHNMSYYGGNDSSGNDKRPEQMVIEACQQLDDTVDFTQYDRDGDGFIDNVFVFYAGYGEASYGTDDTVWPHAWNVYYGANKNYKFDGVRLDSYGCTNEYGYNRPDGVGTFVHEFSHILGIPDLYYTGSSTTDKAIYATPGSWCVMDYGPYNNNGCTPPAYSTYERNSMGWIDLEELSADQGDCTLTDLRTTNMGYCITNPSNSKEFYLFENRQQSGWDKYIPGSGMLVWHVDYDSTSWGNNEVNNTYSHQGVDLVEADGVAYKQDRTAGDCYPGTSKKTYVSPKWWDGTSTGIKITGIALDGENVTFNVGENSNAVAEYLTVSDVLNSEMDDSSVSVRGYIVGYVKSGTVSAKGCVFSASGAPASNILMADSADETDYTACIPVQLPANSAARSAINLSDNPNNLGRYLQVVGTLSKYCGVNAVKAVSDYEFMTPHDASAIESIEVNEAPAVETWYDLNGRKVSPNSLAPGIYIVNGKKVMKTL